MANKVCLSSKEFKAKDGTVAYGFTISDDHDNAFDDMSEKPIVDDFELLTYVKGWGNDATKEIISYVIDEQVGIEINGFWYDWDEIKETIEK